MGACNFEHIIYTTEDMNSAYRMAVEDALHEDGHEPYNGTISTTAGVHLSPLATTSNPLPESQIDWEAISGRLDHLNKWEDCEALPILRTEPPKLDNLPGTLTVEASIPSEVVRDSKGDGYRNPLATTLHEAVNREVRKLLRSGSALTMKDYAGRTHTAPLRGAAKDYRVSVVNYQVAQSPKATSQATKGATETRYFILPMQTGRVGNQVMPAWDTGYSTQAKARAGLPQTLERRWQADFEIVSMTRRADGQGLVAHSLDSLAAKTVKVAITANVSRVLEPGRVTDERGWMFYGWAAC